MSAPILITVETDRSEYSRFEVDRATMTITISVTGSNMVGEEIRLDLIKARRSRDEVVTSRVITLANNGPHYVQTTYNLNDIIDERDIPKMRRGYYFCKVTSLTDTTVVGTAPDFKVSILTVDDLKSEYLHGIISSSAEVSIVAEQPRLITGVTIDEVSYGHPKAAYVLAYNYVVNAAPVVTSGAQPYTLTDGQTLAVRLNGGDIQTVTFATADFVDISAATALEVSTAINNAVEGFSTAAVTGHVVMTGDLVTGTYSIYIDPVGTATNALGLLNHFSTSTVTRTLSWCGGPEITIVPGTKTYLLRRGERAGIAGVEYVKARVSSIAELPEQSHAEELIIVRKPLDDAAIQEIIERAISWVEDTALAVYIEPTRVVTEVDPDAVVFPDEDSTPTLIGADWDAVVDALQYNTPSSGHWINFRCPYYPVLAFDELYGKMSNVRIVDIALEWIEVHEKTGFVELVPFNQEAAFNFIGLVWVESLRGPVPLPNFWNFNAIVGFRKTPAAIIELIAKKAAIDLLTIAGQAYRGGLASQSISRDGVSESVSYTATGAYGIYSASVETYKKWIDQNLPLLKGSFRGPNLIVL